MCGGSCGGFRGGARMGNRLDQVGLMRALNRHHRVIDGDVHDRQIAGRHRRRRARVPNRLQRDLVPLEHLVRPCRRDQQAHFGRRLADGPITGGKHQHQGERVHGTSDSMRGIVSSMLMHAWPLAKPVPNTKVARKIPEVETLPIVAIMTTVRATSASFPFRLTPNRGTLILRPRLSPIRMEIAPMSRTLFGRFMIAFAALQVVGGLAQAQTFNVEGQPLAANARRLLKDLEYLGHPWPSAEIKAIDAAAHDQDAHKLQQSLEPHVLSMVHLNPEARVKVQHGAAIVPLQQGGYTPILIKVHNESGVTKPLRIASPQALPIASGGETRIKLAQLTVADIQNRFLDVEIFTRPGMTYKLNGLKVEYALALIHSTQAGKRDVTLHFDIGQGTQDLGGRAETAVLFDIKPAIPV